MAKTKLGWSRGQAMVETTIAVLVIASIFVALFTLSRLLTGKMLVEHAAMRVARARAVGFNEFMCIKAARISAIPIAGERTQPQKEDGRDVNEALLAKMYMRTPDSSYADGLLQYEDWSQLIVTPGNGGVSSVRMKTDWMSLDGEAIVDGFPLYLHNEGL